MRHRNPRVILLLSAVTLFAGCAATAPRQSHARLIEELRVTEQGFAATMARRDFAAFAAFIAEDAVFLGGGTPLRGRQAVLDDWRALFAAPTAPFAWYPERVEVSGSGDLGYTEGPVTNARGERFERFYTVWRRTRDGRWQAVFDSGYVVGASDGQAARPVG